MAPAPVRTSVEEEQLMTLTMVSSLLTSSLLINIFNVTYSIGKWNRKYTPRTTLKTNISLLVTKAFAGRLIASARKVSAPHKEMVL